MNIRSRRHTEHDGALDIEDLCAFFRSYKEFHAAAVFSDFSSFYAPGAQICVNIVRETLIGDVKMWFDEKHREVPADAQAVRFTLRGVVGREPFAFADAMIEGRHLGVIAANYLLARDMTRWRIVAKTIWIGDGDKPPPPLIH